MEARDAGFSALSHTINFQVLFGNETERGGGEMLAFLLRAWGLEDGRIHEVMMQL